MPITNQDALTRAKRDEAIKSRACGDALIKAQYELGDDLGVEGTPAIFTSTGDYVGGKDLSTLLYESWDLALIDRRYKDFTARFEPEAAKLVASGVLGPQQAFTAYLGVVDHWRKLPFRDPGLPREVLADDWGAPTAVALFERLVTLLEGRALAHAASYW